MDQDDLFELSRIAEQDERFTKLLEQFLEKCANIIRDSDINEGLVETLRVNEHGAIVLDHKREKRLFQHFGLDLEYMNSEETKELIQYIQDEYDYQLNDQILKNLLVDAFGPRGENLDSWRDNFDIFENKLRADIQGYTRYRRIHLLQGLEVIDGGVIFDDMRLYPLSPGRIISTKPTFNPTGMSSISRSDTGFVTSLLEIEVTRDPNIDTMAEYGSLKTNLLLTVFKLYGCANVFNSVTTTELETYDKTLTGFGSSRSSRDPLPRYTVTARDVEPIQNLRQLLHDFYDFENNEFTSPIDIAIEHYDTALSQRTSFHSSIAFTIIGLESLYKHYTLGKPTDSKDVARFAGLLLSIISKSYSAKSIKDEIEDGYETRHSYVHGENGEDEAIKELQNNLWDYLRASIVAFAWLRSNQNKKYLPLSDALIDEEIKSEISRLVSNLKLIEYLYIDPS